MTRVLANGVFDIFHIGHLRYLEAAAALGDVLIVSVTKDAFVNKGADRPMYPELERLAIIRALRCVNSAFLTVGAYRALELVKPNIFVKGCEYRGKIRSEDAEFCRAHNIAIRFTETETVRPRDRLLQS